MIDKLFVATKAFVVYEGKVLILKESADYEDGANAGRYDIVGGRVEPGQRFDDSLMREVKEETGLSVTISKPFFVSEWRPEVRDEKWQIVGIYFTCSAEADDVQLSKDHSSYEWIAPEDHNKYELIDNVHEAFKEYLER